MNVYATESIRNVVLLGHGGCGKTSLIESMAFTTGIIKRVRTVTEGGTVSDYDKEEVKRKFSIFLCQDSHRSILTKNLSFHKSNFGILTYFF